MSNQGTDKQTRVTVSMLTQRLKCLAQLDIHKHPILPLNFVQTRLSDYKRCLNANYAVIARKSEVLGSIPGLAHSFVFPSADSRGAVVSYWRKYVHEVLVNRLGGLSLPRKSVVRLTDRPDMTIDVYRGRKTTTQQQQQQRSYFKILKGENCNVIGSITVFTIQLKISTLKPAELKSHSITAHKIKSVKSVKHR